MRIKIRRSNKGDECLSQKRCPLGPGPICAASGAVPGPVRVLPGSYSGREHESLMKDVDTGWLFQAKGMREGRVMGGRAGSRPVHQGAALRPVFVTTHGALFEGDCLQILPDLADSCVDTVFADPPFNLGKDYGGNVNDSRADEEYLDWCHRWIDECIRVLKPGGAFFLYNLPKWNVDLGYYLGRHGMQFRHWIAINIKFGLPISGRLYPSHYSLIYYTKGKAKTFRRIRTPIETCRHCGGEIKDYGGHRGAMNPDGVNLTDVWNDIPPVRHWKFKTKKRRANALSAASSKERSQPTSGCCATAGWLRRRRIARSISATRQAALSKLEAPGRVRREFP